MRKKIMMTISLLSIMLLSLVISSPISYAETLSEDMVLETELLGPTPEKIPTFSIVIERELDSYPMPHGTINNKFEIKVLGAQSIHFPKIDFEEIGEYTYLIYQKEIDDESYTTDDTTYRLEVLVTLDETHENLIVKTKASKLGESLKIDKINFINEFAQGVLGDKIPRPTPDTVKHDPQPTGVKGISSLPLTGSVDVYYIFGLMSIMIGLLIKTHRKVREKTSS